MRKYELLYIIRPSVDEEAKKALIERFNNVITENGGTVDKTTDMGKRRLAYEINKMREGHYVLLNITAEPKAIQETERLMKISDDVVRQMTTKDER
ncbi:MULTISPECIES: 30S ribosomal protein S6 [Exiguobacterium]|jgi:small subunit ribosomal protein S6|uniref:Small ribosomal subunit protein bS6 n=3 Tax=Exiguobacterium TaxID=33986 RepID=U1MUP5_9BACL|nr:MULTISPECIES: 30S ribosomal protein S6 [Exiguobacterium]ERG65676.1 30S ribosomal protein S6 [Exiguobacterium chiriqhucha RW-2]KAB2864512.1 MAG: 30S ribosomal protein S6 [Exiguobacterium chiriqhucha]KGI84356.1 30S ribosomal protein S6 [Exiguobacterium mexicanum]MCT4776941.1 30S ribosomal protein S6 [Exiguobacterium aquaticum]MCT4789120.1 30S ribosomal protein S6 [Exiguobacterium mexicanum]